MNNMVLFKLFEGDFYFFLPEIFLLASFLLILCFGVIYKNNNIINFIITVSIFIFIITFFLYNNSISFFFELFNSLFISSIFIIYLKLFLILMVICILIYAYNYLYFENIKTFEIIILINFAVYGMLILLSSNDFLSFYLALELQSLSLYILASYKQFSNYSTEAGIKYFVLGAVSSGLLLFGISLIYGLTGLTNFNDLSLFFIYSIYNLDFIIYGGIILSFLLILTGFFFKLGAVPFHMWLPDVYEGVGTLITAFFALVPKIALLGLLSRFSIIILNNFNFNWSLLFLLIAVMSSFFGTFGALFQTKIKRLLAYSAIGHMGFMLLGLSAFNYNGLNSLILYILIYSFLSLIIFGIILSLRKYSNFIKIKNIYDLKILVKSNIVLSIFLALALFSIAGVPPLSGFFSKVFIFFVGLYNEYFFIILSFLIISMVGVFYYLRLIKLIFFDLNSNFSFLIPPNRISSYIIVLSSFFNIYFFLFFNFFFIKINELILYII